jgi:hypothetical protein
MDQARYREILDLFYDTNKNNWQVSGDFFYESMLYDRVLLKVILENSSPNVFKKELPS